MSPSSLPVITVSSSNLIMVSIELGCPVILSLQSPNQSQEKMFITPSYVETRTFLPYLHTVKAVRSSSKLSDIAYSSPFLRSNTPKWPSFAHESSMFCSGTNFISLIVPSCSWNFMTQESFFPLAEPVILRSHSFIRPSSSPVAIITSFSIWIREFIGLGWAFASLPYKAPFEITPIAPSEAPVKRNFPLGENSTCLQLSLW